MKTFEYLVYRVGSNAANQSCTFEPVPIAIVRASSREEAARTSWHGEEISVHGCPSLAAEVIAHCGNLDVWSNQHVYAVPQSKAKSSDWNLVFEADSQRPTEAEEASEDAAWAADVQRSEEEYWEQESAFEKFAK